MDNELEIQQITVILKDAFKSYKCVVEETDYKNALRIHIIDQANNSITHIKSKPTSEINNESKISTFIEQLKEIIRGKGYHIN